MVFNLIKEYRNWFLSQSVQSLSQVQLSASNRMQRARPPCPSPTSRVYSNSCPSSQWSHPITSSSSSTFNLSQHQGLFKWVSSSHQVAKYWSFSFSISPSSEYSGLISFKMDWLDLLAVQGTLKSLLQHHSSKTSILWHSAFFSVLSFLHSPTLTSIHDYWENHIFD